MSTLRNGFNSIAILGGGPAGLATGWALEELGHTDYTIFEKSSVHGGNARTVRFGDFRYDTGPHRFHARHPEATRLVSGLLGPDLQEVDAPARIYWEGRFVDFPLRPLQILKSGGLGFAVKAATDLVTARIRSRNAAPPEDFQTYAYNWFGKTIAGTFLVPFSERLWGLPGPQLSPDIAGRRLSGFSVAGIIKETLFGSKKSDHLEGRFLYPRKGYGQISDKMAEKLSPGRLAYSQRIVGLETNRDRITSVSVKTGGEVRTVSPEAVISTLPITIIARMMDPQPPQEVLDAADKLQFRDVVLVALFIDQESISDAAVTYFQNPKYEFTRAHEPRNRSRDMSPQGKTSLVIEYPCFRIEDIWERDEKSIVDNLVRDLDQMGLIKGSRVFASDVHKMRDAYPVYSKGYKETSDIIKSYLSQFKNLWTLGRGGSFFYGHVHDFVTDGFSTAEGVRAYLNQPAGVGV